MGSALSRDQVGEIRKAGGVLGGGGNGYDFAAILRDARALVVEEEECLIAAVIQFRDDHRSAKCPSELVLSISRLSGAGGEVIARIKDVVAKELPDISVEVISARLGRCVQHCAR